MRPLELCRIVNLEPQTAQRHGDAQRFYLGLKIIRPGQPLKQYPKPSAEPRAVNQSRHAEFISASPEKHKAIS